MLRLLRILLVYGSGFLQFPGAVCRFLKKKGAFTARYIEHVKANIDRYIASVLIFNTVANTLGVSLATSLAIAHFGTLGQLLFPIVLSVLILLFGEITPKTIGVKQARKVGPICAVPMYYVTIFLSYTGLIKLCMTITKHWTKGKKKNLKSVWKISTAL